jgi:hypothetical protein
VVAVVFRYTDMLTYLAIFLLGFSNPTLMNLIFVAIFLVFFSKGDNLIEVTRTHHGRERKRMRTFAKNYWLVIVYYTLLCVIAKYIYFLFFPGDITEKLLPTGIN